MHSPESRFVSVSLTRLAAPSYSCSRKTHKFAWPNPFSKQRKRLRLAHCGLFLFALDTDHGPAAWNLYSFGKGLWSSKLAQQAVHCPVMRGPCSGHKASPGRGAQRGAHATAPTPIILERAASFSPRCGTGLTSPHASR